MSNSEKLAFSILDHLSQYLDSGKISGDTAETLEVAIQCLEQVFKVESYDEIQKKSLKVDKPLQEIFDAYTKEHNIPETSGDPTVMQPTAKDRERAEELKAEGNQLMKMEKYQDALSCYTQAIDMDSSNPVYPCNRAAAYSKLGEHQMAVADCKRALDLDPTYSKAYGRMALSFQNMNDLQRAKENYQKAIELEPDNAFYLKNLKSVEDALSGQAAPGGARGGTLPGAAAAAGMPNLGGMDFASLLSNPAVMNMAQSFMQSPHMQQMVSSMMTSGAMGGAMGGGGGAGAPAGGGGAGAPAGGGGMSQLFQAAQRFGEQLQETNPDLMSELQNQAQETFHSDPNSNPFSSEHGKPDEKGDDQKE